MVHGIGKAKPLHGANDVSNSQAHTSGNDMDDDIHADVDDNSSALELRIFVVRHCQNCDYARQVAYTLGRDYPALRIELIDMESACAEIPETVFATPTYLLDGRVWSLGNPSAEKILTTFGPPHLN